MRTLKNCEKIKGCTSEKVWGLGMDAVTVCSRTTTSYVQNPQATPAHISLHVVYNIQNFSLDAFTILT